MEKQFQLTTNDEIIAYLVKQFPESFAFGSNVKPLKNGIVHDIISRLNESTKLSLAKLNDALDLYMNSQHYLESIKIGVYRIDLDGNPHEIITQEQMDLAKQKQIESKEKTIESFKEQPKVKNNAIHSQPNSLINTAEQMEKQFQLINSKEIIVYLAQQFPNCFTIEGEAKPLKIGIFQDILSRLDGNQELSKTKLRVALRVYTNNWRYLYSIKVGSHRVDLDGNLDEVITQEQMDYAQQQLKESKSKAKEHFKKQNKSKPKRAYTPPKKNRVLKIGDFVKVTMGNKPLKVQIIDIEKDHIKVKVGSGMQLTVKPEHIINQ